MLKKQIDQQKHKIIEDLKAQSKKFAILLYNSNIPDDVKKAWIAMLPYMSLMQIERLLNILELKFLNQETKNIDDEYKNKLQSLVNHFNKMDAERTKRLLKQINNFN